MGSHPGRASLPRKDERGQLYTEGWWLGSPGMECVPDVPLPLQLPDQACPASPLHGWGKLRPVETTGVAHVHQAEELNSRLEHFTFRT